MPIDNEGEIKLGGEYYPVYSTPFLGRDLSLNLQIEFYDVKQVPSM